MDMYLGIDMDLMLVELPEGMLSLSLSMIFIPIPPQIYNLVYSQGKREGNWKDHLV